MPGFSKKRDEEWEDRWGLAKETLLKLEIFVDWRTIEEDGIYSNDPYTYGVMLWWLYERKKEGVDFLHIYFQLSYVMGVDNVYQRIDRFKDCELPLPNFKPGHLVNLFNDFLVDLKRTLQVLDLRCKDIYFHTAP